MLIAIGAFLLSLVPCILLLIWLKKQNEDKGYQTSYKRAMKYGLLSVFPVIGVAAVFALISLAFPKDLPVLAKEAYKDFILAAFAEELVKFLLFKKVLKESRYNYSWRDITAFMIVIGVGFEMMEAILYALMTNPGQILVRGILIMHAEIGRAHV